MATPNHGYNTPEKGTLDWHTLLNENFSAIDADIEVRDLESNAESYTPRNGAKFFAVDTGVIYIGDGEKWNAVTRPSGGKSLVFDSRLTGSQMVADDDVLNFEGAPYIAQEPGEKEIKVSVEFEVTNLSEAKYAAVMVWVDDTREIIESDVLQPPASGNAWVSISPAKTVNLEEGQQVDVGVAHRFGGEIPAVAENFNSWFQVEA